MGHVIRAQRKGAGSVFKSHTHHRKAPLASAPSTSASETGGGRLLMGSGTRSMSEITNVSRFQTASVSTANVEVRERREWLQMVKSTVQWFTGRERRVQSQHRREDIIV